MAHGIDVSGLHASMTFLRLSHSCSVPGAILVVIAYKHHDRIEVAVELVSAQLRGCLHVYRCIYIYICILTYACGQRMLSCETLQVVFCRDRRLASV